MHKHILIPTDGSGIANEAIQYGTDLAKAVNAKVTGVSVSPPFSCFCRRTRHGHGHTQIRTRSE